MSKRPKYFYLTIISGRHLANISDSAGSSEPRVCDDLQQLDEIPKSKHLNYCFVKYVSFYGYINADDYLRSLNE